MSYDDCMKKGLLRRASIAKEELRNQLKIAEDYVRKAELVCGKDTYDVSFLTAYISLFHSARALLYAKGYKERSHFCLFEFVKNEFKSDTDIARLAEVSQNYREMRHLVQYEGSVCTEALAREAITDAKNFLKVARRFVG
jgi:uncharacterized protein (UPF0332 family)